MSLLRNSQLKHLLNKLIDEAVHKKGHPKDLGTMIVDELLHTAVEGEFRVDKFIRYNVLPLVRKPTRRRRLRRRKPR